MKIAPRTERTMDSIFDWIQNECGFHKKERRKDRSKEGQKERKTEGMKERTKESKKGSTR